jgi:hypothetical protein
MESAPIGTSKSAQAIFSATQELNEPQVSQHLELLADFGADVAIGWMQTCQSMFSRINIG